VVGGQLLPTPVGGLWRRRDWGRRPRVAEDGQLVPGFGGGGGRAPASDFAGGRVGRRRSRWAAVAGGHLLPTPGGCFFFGSHLT